MVVSKRVPPELADVRTIKGSASVTLLLPLPCTKKDTKQKGYEYHPMVLQPKQLCWNVHSLLSGLGSATCGQQAVKSPWMLQVFQAEICAIMACAHEIQFQVDQKSRYLL